MKARPIAGATLASSLLISLPLIAQWEGKRNDPYRDLAGILTVCYGETNVQMRRYTDQECKDMLNKSIKKYAGPTLDMTPGLDGHPFALAAATSLSYNTGVPNYAKSTARRLFNQGDIAGGCKALTRFNKVRIRGKLEVVQGLVNRRQDEYRICIKDA